MSKELKKLEPVFINEKGYEINTRFINICMFLCILATIAFAIFIMCYVFGLIDLGTVKYNYGYVKLPNGECIEGNVSSYRQYKNNTVEVTINGIQYILNIDNVVLTHVEN